MIQTLIFRGPKFDLVAHATLKLSDTKDSIRTHDLVMENAENRSSNLPLFGHFCCRLAAQPNCMLEERLAGYIKVIEHDSNSNSTKKYSESLYWASLKNFHLLCWVKGNTDSIINEEKKKLGDTSPDLVIRINKTTKMKRSNGHSLTIIAEDGKTYTLSVLNKEDLGLWASHIEKHIQDHMVWGHAAETMMDIPLPSPSRVPMFLRPRAPGSLYDETPLIGNLMSKFIQ